MNFELNQDTFFVKEIFNPKLTKDGTYNYFIITKKGLSHKQLLARLPVGYFCGTKDKNATTTQWFCTEYPLDEINEANLIVEFKGMSNERLHIGKHKGNKFRVKINVSSDELRELKIINFNKKKICNYFGDQRFDFRVIKLKELFEEEKYEDALKYFLTTKSKFDSEQSTHIKEIIISNWGNWDEIINSDIPDAKKELFIELKKGISFLESFNHVERKSLRYTLRAIQAQRFNLMLHNLALSKKNDGVSGIINGEELLLQANKSFKRKIFVSPTKFEKSFGEKGMERKTFFQPKNFKLKELNNEVWLEFDLGKGNYATVLLEFLKNY